jgi:NADP-dependent 3-hydroxy acid dehydrogenase YdfG
VKTEWLNLKRTFKLTEVHTLLFDVRDKKAFRKLLYQAFSTIDILINNAGNAHGLDPIQNGDLDDWDAMIDINVKGLLYVSKPSSQNDRKIRSYYQHRFHCKEVYQTGMYIVLQNMRLTPKSRNAYGFKPVRNKSAIHPGMVQTEFSEVRFKGDTDRAEKEVYQVSHPYNQKILPILFISWYQTLSCVLPI